jgi:signal transduction histidine kinase
MLAIALVLQLSLALVVLLYHRASISRLFEAEARQRADAVAAALRKADYRVTDDELRQIVNTTRGAGPYERMLVTLYLADGRALASSSSTPPRLDEFISGALPTTITQRQVVPALIDEGQTPSESLTVLRPLESVDGRRFVLMVASTDKQYRAMMGLAFRVLSISLLIGTIAAGVAGWMIAGLATAPLGQLRKIAGLLSPEVIEQDVNLPRPYSDTEAIERELQQVRSKLREALHAQDRFISHVSHELKTPIAVLLTEAQTLKSAQLPEEGREFVRSVTEEMQRLGGMVESFLTLTSIRGGKTLATGAACDINEVAMDAIVNCGKMARQYHVTLSPELIDRDPALMVFGDAGLLRVMIDNLIQNAIRFSPERMPVLVRVEDDGSEGVIKVRDYGPGVPAELIDSLFDRFVQGRPEASQIHSRRRGHGLGLTIAQGIAELHGGRISVRNVLAGGVPADDGSADHHGCEFTVRLPRIQESRPVTVAAAPSSQTALQPNMNRDYA